MQIPFMSHDLESMRWLLIWFVFSRIPESGERLYDAAAVSQQLAARRALFFDQAKRMFCLTNSTFFYQYYRYKLHPLLGPLVSGAHGVPTTLRGMYTKAEESFLIPALAFNGSRHWLK